MKPEDTKYITYTKKCYRWTCNKKEHNHRSKEAAMTCIKNTFKPEEGKYSPHNPLYKVRALWFTREIFNGRTYASLARQEEISPARVAETVNKIIKKIHRNSFKPGEEESYCNYTIKDIQADKVYWLKQLSKLEEKLTCSLLKTPL